MFKPSFGQTTGNTSFGGFGSSGTSTPFGQSTFNKPQGSTFGSAPAFGSSSTPVFGSQAQTSSGLFGSSAPTPAFGQAQPVQSGFGFGASTSGTTNLFGSSQPSSSGLFGSNSAPSFGQQNKPAFSGFSTNPGSALFGSQQTTQVQPSATPLFGQPSTQTSGLFSSNAFGTTGNATTGTVIRFNPVTGTDTINKNQITQTISTRHECITCMKEYEGKSLEELRLEDYLANRKGPQQGAAGTSGLFGSNTLFGSQNPSNTNVGFGAAPSVFGSTNTQTNTLFGNKGFGTVTTSASPFAFNATSTVTPFGAKPFGTTTSSASNLFSAPAAQNSGFGTTSSGFGSFGVQNTGATTSFFNQQKPIGTGFNMPSATGSGFGSMSQSSSSHSVFGAPKPLAPTFGSSTTGFGTAQNTGFSTATPFQTTQQTNNMFSSFNKPSTTGFGLGTAPAASNGFGASTGTTGLFGSTKPTSLFSQPAQQSGFGGFGATTGGFGTSSFGQPTLNTSFAQPNKINAPPQQQADIHEKLINISTQFPKNPLLEGLTPARDLERQLQVTNTKAVQAIIDQDLKFTPYQKSSIKLRPVSLEKDKTLFGGLEENDPMLEDNMFQKRHPRRLCIKRYDQNLVDLVKTPTKVRDNSKLFNNSDTENRPPPDDSWISTPKKALSPEKIIESENSSKTELRALTPINLLNNVVNNPLHLAPENSSKNTSTTELQLFPRSSTKSIPVEEQENESTVCIITEPTSTKNHPTGIKMSREGYFIIPTLDELAKKVTPDGRCIVKGLTIGRTGYGNVYFPDEFDVFNLDVDNTVFFEDKELVVYRDNDNKPPLGQGLNRPAQVTLDRVYPRDKDSLEEVTNPEVLIEQDFEGHLQKNCEQDGSHFIDYRPETGSWVFNVDHFTRYGLSNGFITTKKQEMQKEVHEAPIPPGSPPQEKKVKKTEFVGLGGLSWFPTDSSCEDPSPEPPLLESIAEEPEDSVRSFTVSPNPRYYELLLKRQMFEEDTYAGSNVQEVSDFIDKLERKEISLFKNFTEEPVSMEIPEEQSILDVNLSHVLVEPPAIAPGLKYSDLSPVINKYKNLLLSDRCIADASVFNGLSFKPRWTHNSNLIVIAPTKKKKPMATNFMTAPINKPEELVLNKPRSIEIQKFAGRFEKRLKEHLQKQLEFEQIDCSGDFPFATPLLGPKVLHAQLDVAKNNCADDFDTLYDFYVWKLMEALWGEVLVLDSESPQSHYSITTRRKMVDEWIREVVCKLYHRVQLFSMDGPQIWDHIIMNDLEMASENAVELHKPNLALLICQLRSCPELKHLVQEQIRVWQETGSDEHIDLETLKVHMLVASVPVVNFSCKGDINVCDELRWLESLAFHFWYLSDIQDSIPDIVSAYETSFKNPTRIYSPKPTPLYVNKEKLVLESRLPIYDMLFHLLKLYGNSVHSLEALLNPVSHTSNPMDYSLSWLVMQTLKALDYVHINRLSEAKVHMSFAAQLENMGQWHWAVYVLLHLKDEPSRITAVTEIISRHIKLNKRRSSKERFIIEELHVPYEIFARAKAFKAMSIGRVDKAVSYLIFTRETIYANRLFKEHLLPREMINRNFDYITFMLQHLIPRMKKKDRLNNILWFHIHKIEGIEKTIYNYNEKALKEQIRKLLPYTGSYCRLIMQFPSKTLLQRLMQLEMYKDLINIVKSFIPLVNSDTPLRFLTSMIHKLPLPPDYKLDELKDIVNAYIEKTLEETRYAPDVYVEEGESTCTSSSSSSSFDKF